MVPSVQEKKIVMSYIARNIMLAFALKNIVRDVSKSTIMKILILLTENPGYACSVEVFVSVHVVEEKEAKRYQNE